MATYDEIRQEHREHLRQLPPIEAEVTRVMRAIDPGNDFPVKRSTATVEEVEAAFDHRRAWDARMIDIYRREDEARTSEGQ
jgi:hypothetical protein